MSYDQVKKSMQAGTPLELICAACPWDRLCITPPTMSAADIDAAITEAEQKDKAKADAGQTGMPVQMLLTAIVFGGKDMTGQLCPVFAARLRSPDGRGVADTIRTAMQRFGEPEAGEPR
jgi:hypothetical protein